jgi:hypothetical protein
MNAAAVGDTILLGPGRYTEFAPFTTSGWTEDTYAAVTVDSLTLLGVDRDTVIIGPTEPHFIGAGPKGVVGAANLTSFTLESVTVQNVRDGVYLLGSANVGDCIFRSCVFGLIAFANGVVDVRDCCFLDNKDSGLATGIGTSTLLVTASVFENNFLAGASINQTRYAEVRACTFDGSRGGLEATEGTTVLVSECSFSNMTNGALVLLDSVVGSVERCAIDPMPYGIYTIDGSVLSGSANVIRGTTFASLRFSTNSTADFHGNDILRGTGVCVMTEAYVTESVDIDLTKNYWGTAEEDSISAWILDGNDPHDPVLDPNFSNVIFEPFLMRSIPTKTESMGSLKSRFSGQH